jgi:uncharacterized cupin superfamily protein
MPIYSTISHAASPSNFAPNPIRLEWILEGKPIARVQLLSSSADGMASTFIWDCTAGRFNWFYAFDETFHILEGSASLKEANREPRLVAAGDTIFFPVGSSAEWTVDRYVRKVAFCRTPLPGSLAFARGIAKRLKRMIRGGAQPEGGLL